MRTTVSEVGPRLLARVLDLNDTQTGVSRGIPSRRRSGHAAARPQGLPGDARNTGRPSAQREPRTATSPPRRRHDPAPLLQLEEQGGERCSVNRRSSSPTSCRPTFRQRRGQHPQRHNLLQSPTLYAALLLWLLSEFTNSYRKPGTSKSRGSCCSSTRRTCSSRAPPNRCSTNRAGGAPGAVQRRRRVLLHAEPLDLPRRCWVSSATGSSTRCARSRRKTRRRCGRRRRPCGRRRGSTPCRPSRSGRGRGAGVAARREGHAGHRPARVRFSRRPRGWGPIAPEERRRLIASSGIAAHYERAIDRESAYEKLKDRTESRQGRRARHGRRRGAPPSASGGRGPGGHAERHPVRLDRSAGRAARGRRRGGRGRAWRGRWGARSCAACLAQSSAASAAEDRRRSSLRRRGGLDSGRLLRLQPHVLQRRRPR